MMIAAVVVVGQPALAVDGAAEFAAPDHQRVVEHAALFQILNQRRGGLVGFLAALRQTFAEVRRDDPNRDDRAG